MAEVLNSSGSIDAKKEAARDFTALILETLRSAEGMMTIQEVAASASMNRITAAKYLAVLEARGLVRCRAIGRAKLYSIPKDSSLFGPFTGQAAKEAKA